MHKNKACLGDEHVASQVQGAYFPVGIDSQDEFSVHNGLLLVVRVAGDNHLAVRRSGRLSARWLDFEESVSWTDREVVDGKWDGVALVSWMNPHLEISMGMC